MVLRKLLTKRLEVDQMSKDEKRDVGNEESKSEESEQRQDSYFDPMKMGMGMATMGMDMAKKMMAQMGQSGFSPMGMMQEMVAQMDESQEESQAMPPMMKICMGMYAEMLTAIKRTTDMAALATPELHQLFNEWLETLENEAIQFLEENGEMNVPILAQVLNISEESAAYLIAHLIRSGKVQSRVRAAEADK
jgi:hypothetical protein